MAIVRHDIEEHDVVAIREPSDTWPVGTTGTVVSMYEDATLVEVSWTEPPKSILDYLVTVPFERLEHDDVLLHGGQAHPVVARER